MKTLPSAGRKDLARRSNAPPAGPFPINEHTGLEQRLDWRFLYVRRRPARETTVLFREPNRLAP